MNLNFENKFDLTTKNSLKIMIYLFIQKKLKNKRKKNSNS